MDRIESVLRGIRDLTLDHYPNPVYLIKRRQTSPVADLSLLVDSDKMALVDGAKVIAPSTISIAGKAVPYFKPEDKVYRISQWVSDDLNDVVVSPERADVTQTVQVQDDVITLTLSRGAQSDKYLFFVDRYNPFLPKVFSHNGTNYVDRLHCDFKEEKELSTTTVNQIYLFSESKTFQSNPRLVLNFEGVNEASNLTRTPLVRVNDSEFSYSVTDGTDTYQFSILVSPLVLPVFKNIFVDDKTYYKRDDTTFYFYNRSFEYKITNIEYYNEPDVMTLGVRFSPDYSKLILFDKNIVLEENLTFWEDESNYATVNPSTGILRIYEVEFLKSSEYDLSSSYDDGYIDVIPFDKYKNYDDITTHVISKWKPYVLFDVWPAIDGSEEAKNLSPINYEPLPEETEEPLVVMRRYYFSYDRYYRYFRHYCTYFYSRYLEDTSSIDSVIRGLPEQRIPHLTMFSAFYALEDRRLYDKAADSLFGGADDFDMLSGGANSIYGAQKSAGLKTSVSIGSVFNLDDDPTTSGANSVKKPGGAVAQVGADNILGDEHSYYYMLQGMIRKRFEDIYRDYSLRSNEVVEGSMDLSPVRDANFMAYFDSFPFTISPLARGVVGGGLRNTHASGTFVSGRLV